MGISNKEIVDGLKAGKTEMLRDLFGQFNGLLVAYAKDTVKNPLLAEDFVQDAFCTLWESRQKLNPELPVQSYLYRVVHSRCVDFLRKQQAQANYSQFSQIRFNELTSTHQYFDHLIISQITAKEANDKFLDSIRELPEQTREIFQLSRNSELTNPEIAEKFGISVKSVEYHITKALQFLRKAMEDFF